MKKILMLLLFILPVSAYPVGKLDALRMLWELVAPTAEHSAAQNAKKVVEVADKLSLIPMPAEESPLKENRYRDNQDGTVTDITTRLQWLRCSIGQRWDGKNCQGEASYYLQNEMIKVANDFNYAGHQDWRVPTAVELKSSLVGSTFVAKDSAWYWSSSLYLKDGHRNYRLMSVKQGLQGYSRKDGKYALRVVRSL